MRIGRRHVETLGKVRHLALERPQPPAKLADHALELARHGA